jgi:tetratricopeptide (TPR) repeat protein
MGSLATVLMRLDEYPKALAVYQRMVELDPHRDVAYLGAAKALGKVGQWEEADEMVFGLLKIQPENVEAYTVLGDLALDREDYPAAERWFRKALEIDPDSALAASGLGNCLNRAGRLEEARDLLAAYHRKDPTSHAITYNLDVVSERLGDQRAALALNEQAIKLDPEHSMTWNNLGSILSKMGRQQDAIRCVAKAHELDPDNVEATYNLGALLAQAGRPSQALPLVEEALRARPTLMQAAVLRANLLEKLGRQADALAQWRALGDRNPPALLQVARLELAMGNRTAAKTALDTALAVGGDRARQAASRIPALAQLLAANIAN